MMSEALLLKASLQARLVGIDSDVVLELNSGETVIGRGPILKVCIVSGSGPQMLHEWAWHAPLGYRQESV